MGRKNQSTTVRKAVVSQRLNSRHGSYAHAKGRSRSQCFDYNAVTCVLWKMTAALVKCIESNVSSSLLLCCVIVEELSHAERCVCWNLPISSSHYMIPFSCWSVFPARLAMEPTLGFVAIECLLGRIHPRYLCSDTITRRAFKWWPTRPINQKYETRTLSGKNHSRSYWLLIVDALIVSNAFARWKGTSLPNLSWNHAVLWWYSWRTLEAIFLPCALISKSKILGASANQSKLKHRETKRERKRERKRVKKEREREKYKQREREETIIHYPSLKPRQHFKWFTLRSLKSDELPWAIYRNE